MCDTVNGLRMLISRLLMLLILLMQLFDILAGRVPPLGAGRCGGRCHIQTIIVCAGIGGGHCDTSTGRILKTACHFIRKQLLSGSAGAAIVAAMLLLLLLRLLLLLDHLMLDLLLLNHLMLLLLME